VQDQGRFPLMAGKVRVLEQNEGLIAVIVGN
jgi:hypothetical protein